MDALLRFWFNELIVPVSGSVVAVFVWRHWTELGRKAGGAFPKDPALERMVREILSGLRLELGDLRFTVALPVASAFALMLALDFILQKPSLPDQLPFWWLALRTGILAPIWEEFANRGLIIGGIIALYGYAKAKLKATGTRPLDAAVFAFAILFSSITFASSHSNPTPAAFVKRFAYSLLFGILYLSSGRNLLPPIAAHAAFNWHFALLRLQMGG